jgi:hypothetical protein
MSRKPRSRRKRIAWLRRFSVVLNNRLAQGFSEAWYRNKHWTPADQERATRRKLAAVQGELETLA